MTWRGSMTVKDRIFASLTYLLPLLDVFPFGQHLIEQVPLFGWIYVPIEPLLVIYNKSFVSLIVFFVLYLAVVRNERINHFIRFNAMQAILISIILTLISLAFGILGPVLGQNLLTQTLVNIIFLGTLAASIYSIIQSALGRYAELPGISEASYLQVR
jgi:Chloroplast import component protein (Tic20).